MSSWRADAVRFYEGRRVHSAPGVQEAAVELVGAHVRERGAVLDLGSGSGAIGARLRALGFDDLHAVARTPGVFGETPESASDEAGRLQLDLNGVFADAFERRFGLLVASEVVEHLRSPHHFLAQARELLAPGGHLLLTIPNVANWVGRLRFLLFGELRWFDRELARRLGHITPITDTQMRLMLDDCGLELVAFTSAGSFAGPLQRVVTAPLWLPFALVAGRAGWGDCHVYLARRPGDADGARPRA